MERIDRAMTEQDVTERIKAELAALHSEEVKANNDIRYKYQSGMGIYNLLQDIERARKRRVELETALKILGEFE